MDVLALFHWGSNKDAADIGPDVSLDCTACKGQGKVRLWLFYEYCTLVHIFGIVSRRRYGLLCDACGYTWEVAAAEAKARQTLPARIPFMRRYGLILFYGLPIAGAIGYFIKEFASVWWF
ncbi:MAG TPA: hypothetical protein VHR45_00995 [Thermoanaerobaculia bacterium]|nr:hypothetical protein [Thermoanaerobaculia bacterium]